MTVGAPEIAASVPRRRRPHGGPRPAHGADPAVPPLASGSRERHQGRRHRGRRRRGPRRLRDLQGGQGAPLLGETARLGTAPESADAALPLHPARRGSPRPGLLAGLLPTGAHRDGGPLLLPRHALAEHRSAPALLHAGAASRGGRRRSARRPPRGAAARLRHVVTAVEGPVHRDAHLHERLPAVVTGGPRQHGPQRRGPLSLPGPRAARPVRGHPAASPAQGPRGEARPPPSRPRVRAGRGPAAAQAALPSPRLRALRRAGGGGPHARPARRRPRRGRRGLPAEDGRPPRRALRARARPGRERARRHGPRGDPLHADPLRPIPGGALARAHGWPGLRRRHRPHPDPASHPRRDPTAGPRGEPARDFHVQRAYDEAIRDERAEQDSKKGPRA